MLQALVGDPLLTPNVCMWKRQEKFFLPWPLHSVSTENTVSTAGTPSGFNQCYLEFVGKHLKLWTSVSKHLGVCIIYMHVSTEAFPLVVTSITQSLRLVQFATFPLCIIIHGFYLNNLLNFIKVPQSLAATSLPVTSCANAPSGISGDTWVFIIFFYLIVVGVAEVSFLSHHPDSETELIYTSYKIELSTPPRDRVSIRGENRKDRDGEWGREAREVY